MQLELSTKAGLRDVKMAIRTLACKGFREINIQVAQREEMPAQGWEAEEIPEPVWLGLGEAAPKTSLSPEEIGDHLRGCSDRKIQIGGANIRMVVVGMNRIR